MNVPRSLFASILARLRSIGGRSRRMEQKLDRLLVLTLTEFKMTEDVMARLTKLQEQVNTWTTQTGQELAEAKKALSDAEAKGRAAQKTEDEEAAAADKAAALAKIEEIANGLVAFNPSGN